MIMCNDLQLLHHINPWVSTGTTGERVEVKMKLFRCEQAWALWQCSSTVLASSPCSAIGGNQHDN